MVTVSCLGLEKCQIKLKVTYSDIDNFLGLEAFLSEQLPVTVNTAINSSQALQAKQFYLESAFVM